MTQEDKEYLENLLIAEKKEFRKLTKTESSSNDKFFKINSIISIKVLLGYIKDDSIYLDFKLFFKLYIDAIDESEFNYDNISVEKIISKLNDIEIDQRIKLIIYFRRVLSQSGHLEESKLCDNFIKDNQFKYLKKNAKTATNYFKLLYLWTSLNAFNLILFIGLFYFITLLFLLPAPCQLMKFFIFKQYNYCHGDLVNYSMNTLALMFGLETAKVEPANIIGLMLVILGKVIYITVLLNYLLKHLYKKINISE